MTLAEAGTTRLRCERLESAQLSCEISKSKYLGFVKASTAKYPRVLQATLSQRSSVDREGDKVQDNWVSLETPTSLITLFEDSIRYGGVRGSEAEMLALTDKINALIQSQASSFTVERDLSSSLAQVAFPVLFASIFMLLGIGVIGLTFQVGIAQFNRDCDRLYWTRYSLLGVKKITVPLDEIRNIEIDTEQDSDGVSRYRIYVESDERDRIYLGMTHWHRHARHTESTIRSFLQLEPVAEKG